ncbi:MAG TPA: DMT family transporter [Acidimicrobiia bacterium]|nr:DMT family transporter [Acidimicrobiia bacterium]
MHQANIEAASTPKKLTDRPVLAAVLGALVIATSSILVRLADVEPSTAAFFRCAYALPLLLVIVRGERRRFGSLDRKTVRLAATAGLFFAADLVLWHHSIAEVGAGLATVLGNTQVVIVPFLAWLLLKEPVGRHLVASVVMVMSGVGLISGVVAGDEAYGRNPGLGVLFGVGTGLAYAGFLLVQRQANRDIRRPGGPLLYATAVAAAASLLAGLPLGEINLSPKWPAHGWLLLLALGVQVGGWLLISVSLPRLPAAVTSVLLTVQPVGSVVMGQLLLDERPSLVQLSGVVLIIGGLVLTGRRKVAPVMVGSG